MRGLGPVHSRRTSFIKGDSYLNLTSMELPCASDDHKSLLDGLCYVLHTHFTGFSILPSLWDYLPVYHTYFHLRLFLLDRVTHFYSSLNPETSSLDSFGGSYIVSLYVSSS